MMPPAGPDRDWGSLQPELLGSIAERLPMLDYIRFGAVCTPWASAASIDDGLFLPLPPNQQIPFLLYPNQGGFLTLPDHGWRPLSPLLPDMAGKYCVGSHHGWLAIVDVRGGKRKLSLLNPLTQAEIHLPSGLIGTTDNYEHSFIIEKIILSCPPVSGAPYTALAIISSQQPKTLAFLKEGQDQWHALHGHYDPEDIIYCNGKFLVLDFNGRIWAIDLTRPSPTVIDVTCGLCIPHTPFGHNFLVDSEGDLLQVSICSFYDDHNEICTTTDTVTIRKFDAKSGTWARLRSLGDKCIFLGGNHSISLSTRANPGLKRNCVYFTEQVGIWHARRNPEGLRSHQPLRSIELEDGKLESYYPPQRLLFKCHHPIWFTPSFL